MAGEKVLDPHQGYSEVLGSNGGTGRKNNAEREKKKIFGELGSGCGEKGRWGTKVRGGVE